MTRRKEAGQAIILTAAAMVVLLGLMGLGIDMGVRRYDKRLQQTAADAAAIAGANNLAYGLAVTTDAQAAAAADGYTDNGGGQVSNCAPGAAVDTVCVELDNPPIDGPHGCNGGKCDPKYVEARVSMVHPTYFMRIFNIDTETITARAVATNVSGGGPNTGCLYTLGSPSKEIGVDINGNPTLNAPGCGINDNGNFDPKGNALVVNAGTFGVSGADTGSGPGGTVTCQDQSQADCPAYGTPAASDPFSTLTPPCSPCSGGTNVNLNGGGTVNPGTYKSISLQGNGTVTFNPGIYIIDGNGGFSCSGTPTIQGTGVMFYFTNGATINCQGNDTINLTAPSAANCPACPSQYDGILMYQDQNDTNTGVGKCPPSGSSGPQLGGNNGSSFNGVLYFPADQLDLSGNSGTIGFAINVSDSLCMSGNAVLNVQGSTGLPAGVTLLTNTVLVE